MPGIFENLTLSFISNLFFDKYKKFEENSTVKFEFEAEKKAEKVIKTSLFRVKDVENILSFIKEPVVHFIVDDVPKAYFSVASVIESRVTNEWYVIGSGEFAFQGTPGGYRKSLIMCDLLKKHNLPIVIWCTTENLLWQLEVGELTWVQLKPQLIPFLSVRSMNKNWGEVTERVNELFPKLACLREIRI